MFTRKLGHTQRGGRPIRFDRFHAAQLGGHAVDARFSPRSAQRGVDPCSTRATRGFYLGESCSNDFRDRWGIDYARQMHAAFWKPVFMRPSEIGVDYLRPMPSNARRVPDDPSRSCAPTCSTGQPHLARLTTR